MIEVCSVFLRSPETWVKGGQLLPRTASTLLPEEKNGIYHSLKWRDSSANKLNLLLALPQRGPFHSHIFAWTHGHRSRVHTAEILHAVPHMGPTRERERVISITTA